MLTVHRQSDSLLHLTEHVERDAYLILMLMFKLDVLPLSKQITSCEPYLAWDRVPAERLCSEHPGFAMLCSSALRADVSPSTSTVTLLHPRTQTHTHTHTDTHPHIRTHSHTLSPRVTGGLLARTFAGGRAERNEVWQTAQSVLSR